MKKIVIIAGFVFAGMVNAQQGNVFSKSAADNEAQQQQLQQDEEDLQYQTDADPTDPNAVPVDDYLPLLAVAGAAIALYASRRKRVTA